jgi:hypothetical protein
MGSCSITTTVSVTDNFAGSILMLPIALNPFTYTSGRWLYMEEERLKSRMIDFNFSGLLKAVIDACPTAQTVTKYEKIEGGFNRAFIVYLDNGSRVVARIPFKNAGPPRLTTNSEVATIAYCQK